jgi:hypothetical protein
MYSKRPDQWMNKEYEQNSTARSSHATNHLFFCAIDRAGTLVAGCYMRRPASLAVTPMSGLAHLTAAFVMDSCV